MPRYIDPLVDFSFKKLFGSESNKDILVSFLNALLQERKIIVELIYNKTEHSGDNLYKGTIVFDLLCTDHGGTKFLIEVQRSNQKNFKKRMLYYGSKLIADQAPKGKRKEWDYQIPDVFVIALMDGFTLTEPDTNYFKEISFCNRRTGEVFINHYSFMFLELSRFNKKPKELKSKLDNWMFVLKNLPQLDSLPGFLNEPVFEKVFDIAEFTNLNNEEQMTYDSDLKRKWDQKNAMDFAIEQGLEQGLEKGLEQGRKEEKMRFIRALLLTDNYSDSEIVELTKSDFETVQKIRSEITK